MWPGYEADAGSTVSDVVAYATSLRKYLIQTRPDGVVYAFHTVHLNKHLTSKPNA